MVVSMRIELRPAIVLLAVTVVGTPGCVQQVAFIAPDPTELQCAAVTAPGDTTVTVGPEGGEVRLPIGHGVTIPAGALNPPPREVQLTETRGTEVGFHMSVTPPAEQFNEDVWVTISIENCTAEQLGDTSRWKIYQRPTLDSPGVALPTGYQGSMLWAVTQGNSFFIVAD
jgi:hypothetical protein